MWIKLFTQKLKKKLASLSHPDVLQHFSAQQQNSLTQKSFTINIKWLVSDAIQPQSYINSFLRKCNDIVCSVNCCIKKIKTHSSCFSFLTSCVLLLSSVLQETYLMKHMKKHNPDPLTVAATVAAQQAQGLTPGRGRGRGRGRGAGRANQLQNQTNPNNQNPNPGPPGSYQPQQQPTESVVPCPFDLHQYKTVSASEIQYKPVTVADLPVTHKDLCLTVSTSAIQVEHMNS